MRQFPHGIIARYAAEVKVEVKVMPSNFPAESLTGSSSGAIPSADRYTFRNFSIIVSVS